MGVAEIYSTIIDRKRGPDLLRNPNTATTPVFAIIGNSLGFGGGLFPNAGLQENRTDYEWEMGCLSWQAGGTEQVRVEGPAVPGGEPPTTTVRVRPAKAIKFRANPSDVSWTMTQRSQEQKTKAGTVLHVWNDNERMTYFNEPVITISFQAGNILPVRSILEPLEPAVPEGLNNFYEFMSLVDEVKVLDDGRANLVYIDYKSLIFPKIRLWGFFTPDGISFSDKSANPATVNSWTASFTVYKSDPELGRAIATRNGAIVDGNLAGQPLRERYWRAGYPYKNRRSETFGLIEDASTTLTAIASGQIPPRDVGKAARSTISGASRRITTRAGSALAGAVALTVAGTPNKPRLVTT